MKWVYYYLSRQLLPYPQSPSLMCLQSILYRAQLDCAPGKRSKSWKAKRRLSALWVCTCKNLYHVYSCVWIPSLTFTLQKPSFCSSPNYTGNIVGEQSVHKLFSPVRVTSRALRQSVFQSAQTPTNALKQVPQNNLERDEPVLNSVSILLFLISDLIRRLVYIKISTHTYDFICAFL